MAANPKSVVLVGRPNVGKSTLFNRLVGGRPAMVHGTPGVTRDLRYGDIRYEGHLYGLTDTGGFDPLATEGHIAAGIRRYVDKATQVADVLLFVIDGKVGVTSVDRDIAALLRKIDKNVVCVVNKIDSTKRKQAATDVYELGFSRLVFVSAEHNLGMESLMDSVVAECPSIEVVAGTDGKEDSALNYFDADFDPDDESSAAVADARKTPPKAPRLALVGKPNAGKSSLLNRLLGVERALVHDMPGTTTDPIDSEVAFLGKDYIVVDTAGIRRRPKVTGDVEKISVTMALSQIDRADIAILVIDAEQGVSDQDARIFSYVREKGKGLVVALNKVDLFASPAQKEKVRTTARDTLHFLKHIDFVFLSALRGMGLNKLMASVDSAIVQFGREIPVSTLNEKLLEWTAVHPPPSLSGRPVRLSFLRQVTHSPPTFVFWANRPRDMTEAYKKYLRNSIRRDFGFRGVPLRIFFRTKKAKKAQLHSH